MPRRPRILQISNHYLQPGGEDESVERIARKVGAIAELERCCFDSRQWTGATAPSLAKQAQWMLHNPDSLSRIQALDERFEPDVWLVHNVFPVGSAEIYNLAQRLERPVIQYLHNYRPLSISGYSWAGGHVTSGGFAQTYLREIWEGAWQNSRLKSAWFSLILWRMRASQGYRSISAWIAISDFVRSRFIKAGFPAHRVHAIRHSWELRNWRLPLFEDKGYYLFLGRLVDQKGVSVLLRAWSELERKLGTATPQLKICGQGPLEDAVRAACSRQRSLTFCGHTSGAEKDRLLRGCRAMIAPSLWWEPLGLVTYEAYDYGKPMLAASSGGLTETVSHGETGLLHQPGDWRELANQVLTLELNRALRQKMGTAGREWLVTHTGAEAWTAAFARVLQQITQAHPEAPAPSIRAEPLAVG